jgi:hypothetical protein
MTYFHRTGSGRAGYFAWEIVVHGRSMIASPLRFKNSRNAVSRLVRWGCTR